MIKISNIKMPIDYSDDDILSFIVKKLKISKKNILSFEYLKKSLDARKKNDIKYILTVKIKTDVNELKAVKTAKSNDISIYKEEKYIFNKSDKFSDKTVIVGAGPAGLFCAYILVKSGLKPIIIEQGEKVEDRIKSVEKFFEKGILNTSSNVQFGEGGAGTFSDGKLNTGIKDKRIKFVLETFAEFGAPKEILFEQKPHIGTDILRKVIVNIRNYITENGGKFLFNTTFTDFKTVNNKITSVTAIRDNQTLSINCDNLVLAIGHSSRDTFKMLYEKAVPIIQKPFAVGVRIEHKQEFINKIQYGSLYNNPNLPVADYKTAVHLSNGRSLYSFCMCPGGFVVAAASEKNRITVNGMSNYKRDNINANSALLVNVNTDDFGSSHPLAGVEFQRKIEEKAYNISNSYSAPSQSLSSFLYGIRNKPSVTSTYKPNTVECNLSDIFPEFIIQSLKEGIPLINNKLNGFADENAVLTAPETRSSSPVRILRNADLMSEVAGLYPCGEGAGYAGGITSAAIDGIKIAEKII